MVHRVGYMKKVQQACFIAGIVFALMIPLWSGVIVSHLPIHGYYNYHADLISVDNFYNITKGEFEGDQISKTEFSYVVLDKIKEIAIIKNTFEVKSLTGEQIFSVERVYGIDSRTHAHVAGYGDKNRTGYLFAPHVLKPQNSFTYWHINYDAPATMQLKGKEIIGDLPVYHYVVIYNTDQTANLGNLPDVPEERGITVDITLHTWIEPVSGMLVKYEDYSAAYYYNITTGERLYPWNKFHNKFADDSIARHAQIAYYEKQKHLIAKLFIPFLWGAIALAFFTASTLYEKRIGKLKKEGLLR